MQVLPQPCCGAEPYLSNGKWNTKCSWGLTGYCNNCGAHKAPWVCANDVCRGCTEKDVRFCESCTHAFKMGVLEVAEILREKAVGTELGPLRGVLSQLEDQIRALVREEPHGKKVPEDTVQDQPK